MSASTLPLAADLMKTAGESCLEAGAIALDLFRPGASTAARTWSKSGGSPVTEADIGVDTFLRVRLSALLPEAAWLSEETVDDAQRLSRRFVWVVDPIDGTRAYMSGSPDWAVCVALLDEGSPVLGIVHAPACGATYTAIAGSGAKRNGEAIRTSSIHRVRIEYCFRSYNQASDAAFFDAPAASTGPAACCTRCATSALH